MKKETAGRKGKGEDGQTKTREVELGCVFTQTCVDREGCPVQDENVDHSKTKARSPQSNGICERFHKTVLDEFYRFAFRKKVYITLEGLQKDLDGWIKEYNENGTHSGKYCYGKTLMQTFLDSLPISREKLIVYNLRAVA